MDVVDNIAFVREVEKHPCVYNTSLETYTKRNFTEKAWIEIATKSNMSVPDCKEKWRKLRTALAKALRPSVGRPHKKPYYLLQHMAFLIPHMSIKSPIVINLEDTSLRPEQIDPHIEDRTKETDFEEEDDRNDSEEKDLRDIIRFLKEIEKHPCIYDTTHEDYMKRSASKAAWIKIAKKTKIPNCKEKWKNLRTALAKAVIQKTNSGDEKPYLLLKHMGFLLPFLKTKSETDPEQETESSLDTPNDNTVDDSNSEAEASNNEQETSYEESYNENDLSIDNVKDMNFPMRTDIRDNIRFVEEVKRHPCLFDVSHRDYTNTVVKQRAWAQIAKDTKTSDCRERWRKLRTALGRSFRNPLSSERQRPYYLLEHMTFVLPFMNLKSLQNPEVPSSSPRSKSPVSSHSFDQDDIQVRYLEACSSEVEEPRPKKRKTDSEDTPRKMFLLSILPEVEKFSEEEMNEFRKSVVGAIDQILSNRSSIDQKDEFSLLNI